MNMVTKKDHLNEQGYRKDHPNEQGYRKYHLNEQGYRKDHPFLCRSWEWTWRKGTTA